MLLSFFISFLFSTPITVSGTEQPVILSLILKEEDAFSSSIRNIIRDDLDRSLKFQCIFNKSEDAHYTAELKIIRAVRPDLCDVVLTLYHNDKKQFLDVKFSYESKINPSNRDAFRELAHILSDHIFEKVHGVKGHFNTKIAYVLVTGYGYKKVHWFFEKPKLIRGVPSTKLVLADYDGHNQETLFESNDCILSPEFSPCGNAILFRVLDQTGKQTPFILSLVNRKMVNLVNVSQNIFGKNIFGNTISSLHFGKDKSQVLLAKSNRGTTNIFCFDLSSKKFMPLTMRHKQYIQTCPSYSLDGQFLSFSSDRDGRETLYVQNSEKDVVRLPLPKTMRFSQPVWVAFSKNKQRLYFSGRGGGYSSIWYLDYHKNDSIESVSDTSIKQVVITQKPSFIERPSPAKNGMYFMYIHHYGNSNELVMMDEKGREIPGHEHLAKKNITSVCWSQK